MTTAYGQSPSAEAATEPTTTAGSAGILSAAARLERLRRNRAPEIESGRLDRAALRRSVAPEAIARAATAAPLRHAPPRIPPDHRSPEERRIEGLVGRSNTPRVYRDWDWGMLESRSDGERRMHTLMREAATAAGNEDNAPMLIALVAPEGGEANNGTGKTLVCSIAALECCRRGVAGRCTPMIAMLERARLAAYEGVGPDGAERRPRAMEDVLLDDWARSLPFLALDECDKGRGSDDEWLNVGRLVDRRTWLPGTVTVLCTNLSERELAGRLGNSVMDRTALVVACDWGSRRKRIGGS